MCQSVVESSSNVDKKKKIVFSETHRSANRIGKRRRKPLEN